MEQKQLQLQPRLALLAALVPPGSRLADVGTDHGYLPVYLLQQGRIPSAIAADIGAEPLEHARRTAGEYNVTGLELRLCDGLAAIHPDEVDTVAIAGMGGETIIHILENAPWTKDGSHELLLQPMTRAADLRRWLSVNGYTFTSERLVRDKGYLYPVLCVRGGSCPPLTEKQLLCGVKLSDDPLYGDYLTLHAEKLHKTAAGLRQSRREDAVHRAAALEALAEELEKERGSL